MPSNYFKVNCKVMIQSKPHPGLNSQTFVNHLTLVFTGGGVGVGVIVIVGVVKALPTK